MKWIVLLLGLLPSGPAKNWALSRVPGVNVHRSASVGPVVLLGVARLDIGAEARVAAFNMFRRLEDLVVGPRAEVGSFNWFSSAPFLVAGATSPTAGHLAINESSSVTSRHYIDASGGVTIGRFSTLAGVRSTIMTHGIDVKNNRMLTESVDIGEYSMVGGNVKLVLGARVPARSIVAMGSTVVAGLEAEESLYAGSPATRRKRVAGKYFARVVGPVPAAPPMPTATEPPHPFDQA